MPSHDPSLDTNPPLALSAAELKILDLLDVKVYVKDLNSRFTYMNSRCLQNMRVNSLAEVIGKTDADFFTADLAAQQRQDEIDVMTTGKPKDKLECEQWGDKRQTWVLTSKVPLRGPDGTIIGVVGTSKDVTDFENKALAYEFLLDQIPDPMWVKNADLKFVFVNAALAKLLGKEKKEIHNKTDQDHLTIQQEIDQFRRDDLAVLSTGKTLRKIEKITTRDSQVRTIETQKVRLPGPDAPAESKYQVLGIARDVTEQIRAQRALQDERQARTIAHALNGWIAVMEGSWFCLKLTHGDSPDLARLICAIQYVKHAAHVATCMHALQAVAEPRSVDLNELVKSVTSVFADVAVGFSPTYPGTRIIGSAFHIQNALLELLSNARDFTHHLGPSAAIRVWIDSQGDMHHIHVVDNGPGVLPTLGDSIFDLFVTSVEKRTGMGLAYVKQVALAYAGKVQYLSGDNGAHFVLSFPKLGMPTE